MAEIFLRTLPFFALIGLGYGAGRTRFFPPEATAWLTRFVFYFALSAMLFGFAAKLPLARVFDGPLIMGYLFGCALVYAVATGVAMLRRLDMSTAAIEAQCAVIGNTGFLGLPMFAMLFGDKAIGPMMLVLATDMIVFSSLIVVLITAARSRLTPAIFGTVGMGLLRNPMIVSISLGLIWSALRVPMPGPLDDFLRLLGAAATPGALFAIGASLADKSAERLRIAGWLSLCKLVLHPAAVALGLLVLFPVDGFSATVVISAAALPVAGNVYMLAQHYGVAPHRVSATILVSTAFSILTIPLAIAWAAQA